MTDNESLSRAYHDRGATLIQGLAPHDVARALVFQAQRGVGKKGGPAYQKPTVGTKETIEVYGFFWPTIIGFHWGLTSRVAEIVGARLAPSYCYFRTYQRGDVCKVHVDRPSCEHSMSLTLGYADGEPWALCVGERKWTIEEMRPAPVADGFGDEAFDAFPMQVCDAVLYKGVDYRHGRVQPNPNRWSAHLFLHWVDVDGPCAEWAFDKQQVFAEGDFAFPQSTS